MCLVGMPTFSFYINCRTKLTLTPLHSRMLPDDVEAVEVCAALYKKGLFVDEIDSSDGEN